MKKEDPTMPYTPTHDHSGEAFNEVRNAANEFPDIPGYPWETEQAKREAEECLVHFLFEERFEEAFMAVQNLEHRSRDYLARVSEVLEGGALEGPETTREFRERALQHATRSLQLQDGTLTYLKRRMETLHESQKKRERISKMISLLIVCRHRDDLTRRRVIVSQGGELPGTRETIDR